MYACFSMWLNNINLLQAQLQGFNYTVCFTSRTSKLLDAADFNKPIENLFVPSVETGYLIGSTETYDLVNLVNYTNFLTDVPTLMRIGNFWKFFNLFDIKGMEKSQSHYKNFPISKYFWTHWLQYQNIKVRDK